VHTGKSGLTLVVREALPSRVPRRLRNRGLGPLTGVGPDGLADLLRAALAPNFILIKKLGAGGMASVYLAKDPALK
jgi:serine/threonine protein kinase